LKREIKRDRRQGKAARKIVKMGGESSTVTRHKEKLPGTEPGWGLCLKVVHSKRKKKKKEKRKLVTREKECNGGARCCPHKSRAAASEGEFSDGEIRCTKGRQQGGNQKLGRRKREDLWESPGQTA